MTATGQEEEKTIYQAVANPKIKATKGQTSSAQSAVHP
jgi:hypothetical protein